MDCSTIIVSFNTFDDTRRAVSTALASGASIHHEVIVVDNGSPDGSEGRLRHHFSADARVRILGSGGNIGFAAANNVGADVASGRVLFFLNPDTLVHADAIPALATFLDDHPEVGAVGPRVLNPDGTDQATVLSFLTSGEILRQYLPVLDALRGRDRRTDLVPATSGPVDVVKGCALAIPRRTFDMVGGWDTSYFMYAEEVELCWQLRQAGYETYYFRDPVITHLGGVASRDRYVEQQILDRSSALQFLRRHGGSARVLLNRLAGAIGFGSRVLGFSLLIRLRPEQADDYYLRREAAAALFYWFARVYE